LSAIVSGPFLGIFIILFANIVLDFFLIGPLIKKNILEQMVNLPLTALTGLVMTTLTYVFQNQIVAADKEKQIALATKLAADKEKQIALEAKVAADKAIIDRDVMIGVISHELKNPLTNMQLSASLLLRVLPEGSNLDKARDLIQKLGPSIQRMSNLVSDLLDVTRVEAKALKVEMRESSLDEITLNVIDAFKVSAKEKSLNLSCDIPCDCLKVVCDPDRTFQILSNLISNAIKFTGIGGSISIHAKKLEREIEVGVTDTGKGISDESLPHVFDRFWQEKQSAHIGTGLGLAIAKGLVEAQGGKMWVKSQHGFGTTFYFTLLLSDHGKKFISGGCSISKGQATSLNGSSLS
jgi:signal transduction histidine kinase